MTTNIPTAALAHPMIAGLGFTRMALSLAQIRVVGRTYPRVPPWPRRQAVRGTVSAEYYRIVDNAWSIWLDGHQPITRIVL